MKPPRLPPLIARRLRDYEQAVKSMSLYPNFPLSNVARRRRTLTLAIRKAIAAGK